MQMKDDRQLTYSFGLMKWAWDIDTILSRYRATDNVVDLMRSKLSEHSVAVEVLPIAAALGAMFSLAVLESIIDGLQARKTSTIVDDDRTFDLKQSLEECVEAGFLEVALGAGNFRFVHDKVQESALQLLEEKTKLSIGDIFVDQFIDEVDLGDSIYSAVNLANLQSSGNIDEKRLVIAKMNAVAGERAMERAAFGAASKYLSAALSLLPDDHWERDSFSLRLYTLAGAAAFCNGNHDKVKLLTDEVLEQSNAPLLDKLDLALTLMETAEVAVDGTPGFELGIKILEDPVFKCKFPKSSFGITLNTLSGLLKAKFKKKKLLPQALESMPIRMDKHSIGLMRTLDKLSRYVGERSLIPF